MSTQSVGHCVLVDVVVGLRVVVFVGHGGGLNVGHGLQSAKQLRRVSEHSLKKQPKACLGAPCCLDAGSYSDLDRVPRVSRQAGPSFSNAGTGQYTQTTYPPYINPHSLM
jgi:hypothetical protein